jgi:hypothetical protein
VSTAFGSSLWSTTTISAGSSSPASTDSTDAIRRAGRFREQTIRVVGGSASGTVECSGGGTDEGGSPIS